MRSFYRPSEFVLLRFRYGNDQTQQCQRQNRSGHKEPQAHCSDEPAREPAAGDDHSEQQQHRGHDDPQRSRMP